MRHARLIAFIVAIGIVVSAIYIRTRKVVVLSPITTTDLVPVLDVLGSEHSHASIIISINGSLLSLGDDRYMERDLSVHLHDNDSVFIHKHAKGVTLGYFLNTLGIELTKDCLSVDSKQYCSGNDGILTVMINRIKLNVGADAYEIRDQDKILIDYSMSSGFDLMLLANSIPDLTDDLLNGVE
ncbi:MAG TPA: hypothetical protein VJJ22_02680 [Candidatus Paceibacterota bacterium]